MCEVASRTSLCGARWRGDARVGARAGAVPEKENAADQKPGRLPTAARLSVPATRAVQLNDDAATEKRRPPSHTPMPSGKRDPSITRRGGQTIERGPRTRAPSRRRSRHFFRSFVGHAGRGRCASRALRAPLSSFGPTARGSPPGAAPLHPYQTMGQVMDQPPGGREYATAPGGRAK